MPYTINGTSQNFVEPVLTDGTTYVPLGNVSDAIGGIVEWDNMTKVATVEVDTRKVRVQADNPNVETAEGMFALQAAPFIESGVLWVPVRFFEQVLNCEVTVNGDDVHITRKL